MQLPVTIIMPCYNEGAVAIRFLQQLQDVLEALPGSFHVLMVNDGSTDDTGQLLRHFGFSAGNISIETITLLRNSGHQKAIYEGFLHAAKSPGEIFIIMDCDGQDAPSAIPALLAHTDTPIVNVVRSSRPEPMWFRAGYYGYRVLFRMLTGRQLNYGNFCLIRRPVMEKAIEKHFTHLAAFLSRQQCGRTTINAERDKRLGGKSKMGLRKLFRHAASSFAEYGYRFRMREAGR